jgi:hypothetical protein
MKKGGRAKGTDVKENGRKKKRKTLNKWQKGNYREKKGRLGSADYFLKERDSTPLSDQSVNYRPPVVFFYIYLVYFGYCQLILFSIVKNYLVELLISQATGVKSGDKTWACAQWGLIIHVFSCNSCTGPSNFKRIFLHFFLFISLENPSGKSVNKLPYNSYSAGTGTIA